MYFIFKFTLMSEKLNQFYREVKHDTTAAKFKYLHSIFLSVRYVYCQNKMLFLQSVACSKNKSLIIFSIYRKPQSSERTFSLWTHEPGRRRGETIWWCVDRLSADCVTFTPQRITNTERLSLHLLKTILVCWFNCQISVNINVLSFS